MLPHLCCHCFHLWECLSVYFHVTPHNTPHELVFKGKGGREALVTRRTFLVEIGVGARGD